ncbi:MAG: PcfJ domain-containing protein, partial [Bacteroidota bacterium]
ALQQSLKQGKRLNKNPIRFLNALYEQSISYHRVESGSGQQRIGIIFQQMWASPLYEEKRKDFYELLKALAQKKALALFEDSQIVNGLCTLSQYKEKWMRPLAQWKPKSHNRDKQFRSLLRYLLAKYPVPYFMDEAFFRNVPKYIDWFIYIGQGGNMRKAPNLPLKMTKKMAHYFLQAPDHYQIPEALRYGQVLGMGGNERLLRAINGTNLGRSFENEDFWSTVIQFFVNQTPMDLSRINPIVDYIQQQKFNNRRVMRARGVIEDLAPPQPDFNMKGRSLNSLLRAVHQWHLDLRKQNKLFSGITWVASQVSDFIWMVHEDQINQRTYEIRQLLTSDELALEGNAQSHCVGSYVSDCVEGDCTIWSMTVEDVFQGRRRAMTVELDNNNEIVQARAKYNSIPDEEALQVLTYWAVENDLKMSKWLND